MIVITRREHEAADLEKQLRSVTAAPIVRAELSVDGLFDLSDSPISYSQGTKVALFCAIGHPEAFYKTVQSCGLDIVMQKAFPDHEVLSPHELRCLQDEAETRGAYFLVCTEKDLVRIDKDSLPRHKVPIAYLRVSLQLSDELTALRA
jgi:tetraacyldisaccharide 4'-kinase